MCVCVYVCVCVCVCVCVRVCVCVCVLNSVLGLQLQCSYRMCQGVMGPMTLRD